MTRRSKYDWDAIARDYRTGQFTVRELAAKHGAHYSLIAKMMKKFEVTPDLSAEVRKATNASLARAMVADHLARGVATDATLAAAEANRLIIDAHRTQLITLRTAVAGMTAELQGETVLQLSAGGTIAQAAQSVGLSPEELGCLLRAPSLSKRAQIAERLVTTLARLIPLERQSRGLDDAVEDASFEALLERVHTMDSD